LSLSKIVETSVRARGVVEEVLIPVTREDETEPFVTDEALIVPFMGAMAISLSSICRGRALAGRLIDGCPRLPGGRSALDERGLAYVESELRVYASYAAFRRSAVDGKPARCTTDHSRAHTVREAASVLFIEQSHQAVRRDPSLLCWWLRLF
jgi:hypothetical protein